jgi:hypothetical protein
MIDEQTRREIAVNLRFDVANALSRATRLAEISTGELKQHYESAVRGLRQTQLTLDLARDEERGIIRDEHGQPIVRE